MTAAKTKPLRVGILGLGRISAGFDEPDGPAINTHIKACLRNPSLVVAAIADSDDARARDVGQRWGLADVACSPEQLWTAQCDILCIATPDETHLAMARRALQAKPRLVLCEKPLASDVTAARALVDEARSAHVPMAVNFLRRWLPGVSTWLKSARSGAWGQPVGARLVYSRGWRHNACHGMDLIGAALGGDCRNVKLSATQIADFSSDDSTVSGFFEIEGAGSAVPVQFLGVDGRSQTAFETEIHFTGGRLRVWDEDGMRVRFEKATPLPDGFAPEQKLTHEHQDQPPVTMAAVWANLADHLNADAPLSCSGADIVAGMRLIDAVDRARVGMPSSR